MVEKKKNEKEELQKIERLKIDDEEEVANVGDESQEPNIVIWLFGIF